MSEKGLYSPLIRRIITIVLLIGITGSFIAIYYLIYLPQQRTQYNLSIFRILHEISNNFKQRVENYGTVYSHNYISQKQPDKTILPKQFTDDKDSINFNATFLSSFKGNALSIDSFRADKTIQQDSVIFFVNSRGFGKDSTKKTRRLFTTKQSLAEILQPIIAVHTATFQSILLIKQKGDTVKKGADKSNRFDAILYKSENADIANINTDSLFHNKNIEAPVISNLNIEGIEYKMFLLPFKLQQSAADTYVLAGIISGETYRSESQSIPVHLLLALCLILIVLLLMLPFLKIYFLSSEENITVKDVRTIIVVVFIIPFFVVLLCASTWIHLYRAKWSTDILQHLQNNVQRNFYNEINQGIQQLKSYDQFIVNAYAAVDTSAYKHINTLKRKPSDTTDLKDIVFYPKYYKNFTGLHWLNDKGNDIAVWTLVSRLSPNYFQLSDRQYFRDIKYRRGYVLPNAPPAIENDSFSIQPVLSRLTGEYTINIATHSRNRAHIATGKKQEAAEDNEPKVIGLSSRMYSLWNTVVPKGFAFCIVDEWGNVVSHSDTARSLQENIFQESGDSLLIRNAINHKDSVLLPDINLYETPVRMIIRPMEGLPYYLITYYNKRGEYLFLLHIVAFAFLCQSTLLLFASLFSYCMMLGNRQDTKLLFIPADLNWLHPSPNKINYYRKLILLCLACLGLFCLFATFYRLFYTADDYYLFIVNAALLLPLFVVTGYYMIKRSREFAATKKDENSIFNIKSLFAYLRFYANILVLYVVSILIYAVLKEVLFFGKTCADVYAIKCGIWLLIGLALLSTIIIARSKTAYNNSEQHTHNNNYLRYFIVALLLAVMLISVVPAVSFISYAFREEKALQLQSFQINIAKNIQQRRTALNQLFWKTKLYIDPFKDTATAYINNLKFDTSKGIYLLNNTTLKKVNLLPDTSDQPISCSPFYRSITEYLFLPPDHDEFYDNPSHNKYYYWRLHQSESNDKLELFYNNITDNKSAYSFTLTSLLPHTYLFDKLTTNYIGILMLLLLVGFAFVFYKTIYSITRRVFLINFFNLTNTKADVIADTKAEDTLWLQKSYKFESLKEACKDVLTANEELTFAAIRKEENKALKQSNGEAVIIGLHLALSEVYENIWKKCTDVEKYTLYDYALDGFTNYKQAVILYDMYRKGLLVKDEDGSICLMTKSFRNFLITKQTTDEVKRLSRASKTGSWSTLRTVFYIILIASAIFIFISQEEASKRLITIITSFGALLPAILKLFDKSTFIPPAASKSNDK